MRRFMLKEEVIQLRLKGKTYSEIQEALGRKISKSTLSDWCRNLIIPKNYQVRLDRTIASKLKRAREKAYTTNRIKREKFLEALKNKNLHLVKKIDTQMQKLLLSILYLAEGAKHKSTKFLNLGSSDPNIVRLYLKLLKNCFRISKSKFRIRIQGRYDQKETELERFWGNVTKINKKQFYPTYKDIRTKGKPTLKEDYKGVCMVHYFDTSIQLELELLADSVIKSLTTGR